MKVLLFANTDWYLYNFRLPLAEMLRGAGHEVVLVSPPGKYAGLLVEKGFRHVAFSFSRRGVNPAAELAAIGRLRALYCREQPDLLHHFTIKCVLYGAIAVRLAGLRAVVNAVPGLGHVFVDRDWRPRLLRPLVKSMYRFALRGTQVIFQNPDDQKAFLDCGLVPPGSTHLIRGSGVDVARFRPAGRGPEVGEVRVLFAGRLLWSKGVAEYVEAARLAQGMMPGLRFVAAGEPDPGNPASVPQETVQRWQDEGTVHFMGHCDDMRNLIANTDIAVLPSHGEGLPRFLLEAAASGLPLVASNVPGCREIVRDGANGYLVPVRDAPALARAILALASDARLRATMGAESRRLVCAEFAQEEVLRRTLDVYSLALENPVARRVQASGDMRLLFINRYFAPDISATAQLLTELAEDLDAKGDRVTVITGKTAYFGEEARLPAHEMHRGIRIVRVGFTSFGRSRTLGRLADYLSFWISALWAAARMKGQDCLVVLSDPPLLSVLAALVRFVKPVKTVCWLQDVFPEVALRAGVLREGLIAQFLKRMARWSLRRMDQIVVIGRCMERHLVSDGLLPHTIVKIPNWADGRRIRPVPRHDNAFLREQGLQDRFVVMYSGNHGVVHEFETIVALIRETKSVPGICFCFVGEGAWKSRLVEIVQVEGWQHVVFLPYQPQAMLQVSLSAADVHLVSLRTEMEGCSIPSKIYGVLAAGRPVIFIGPPDSEPATIVREGEFGYAVPSGDIQRAVEALLALYRDPILLARQGQAARQYFNRYCDRSIATERFQQVLQRVTAPPSLQPVHRRTVSSPIESQ